MTRGPFAYDFGDTAGMTPLLPMHTLGRNFVPEANHAIALTIREALKAKEEGKEKVILVNWSGHGLVDMAAYDSYLSGNLSNHSLEDGFAIRCPRLCHQISFSYCLHENGKLPCFKILDCWHSYFQVEKYLRETITEEEWENTFSTSGQPKILTLIELIQKAKNSKL